MIGVPDESDHEPASGRRTEGPRLTERQIEVVRLVVEGLSNQQIADELNIARTTAQSHVASP